MDRLTSKNKYGDNVITIRCFDHNDWTYDPKEGILVVVGEAANKLAAYEDTGLTPDKITAMKADNKRLHDLIDIIEETIKAL